MPEIDFIKKSKEEYKNIGYVECPAFPGEKVYFNRKGFQHLLYKKGDRRNKLNQVKRLELIKDAVEMVKSSKNYYEHRKDQDANFWSLVKNKNGMLITVVILQKDKGHKYFLSVMYKKLPKSTKTP